MGLRESELVVRAQEHERLLSFDCSGRSMANNINFIFDLDLFPFAYLTSLDIPLIVTIIYNGGHALSFFVFRLSYQTCKIVVCIYLAVLIL